MGYGDFKLLAALGAWLGWQMLPLIVLLSSVVGAVDRHRADRVQGPRSHEPAAVRAVSRGGGRDRAVLRTGARCRLCLPRVNAPFVIGLTGGIGSGKSAVADAFAALGVDVTDTDRLAHALTAPGAPGYDGDRAAFGAADTTPTARSTAPRLRARVVRRRGGPLAPRGDPASADRRRCAAARSPAGRARTASSSSRCCSSAAASARIVSRILVVDCPEDEQVRRVARAQRPRRRTRSARSWRRSSRARERLARADDVIDNAGPHERHRRLRSPRWTTATGRLRPTRAALAAVFGQNAALTP